ncbi:uncharacterized protein E6C27_scaffold64G001000 [Cucumis melo var. makuwa]|uniref:Integrase catalytic domain-containing protein n=1 Tax=Cucumis melo var. makuwa TaxID=1194695 RepID=A0A5A7TD08_CUCMM|nr:uncharacterized protein E6C27_scaffold64G001000 [Cucumis melo var. makuwa]
MIDKLCEKFKIKQYKSSMYNATANGLVEVFNKTLYNLIKKIISKSKRDWQERIGEALWAYRTTHRTPMGVTPYSLVYGVEVVLPLEREIPSLRMAVQEGLTTEDNVKLRLQELEALDEKRLEAQQALECYQTRMSKAFDKHVKPRSFQVGDLVLADDDGATLHWLLQEDVDGKILPPPLEMMKYHLSKQRRCPIAPTRAVDLTAKAQSSLDRSWIADGSTTSPNYEGVRSLLPGGGSDSKSLIVSR